MILGRTKLRKNIHKRFGCDIALLVAKFDIAF